MSRLAPKALSFAIVSAILLITASLKKLHLSATNDNAIRIGFEKHSSQTKYNSSAQSLDWNLLWSDDSKMNHFSVITDEIAHSGKKSLKIIYPSNTEGGGAAAWQIPAHKEYYLSYWIRFERDFDFDGPKYSNGKLPGLGGAGGLCPGIDPCDGNNGFTTRFYWRENGKALIHLAHMNIPKWGDELTLKGRDGKDKYYQRGQWHNLIQRVRINDGNRANGEVEVWMDFEKVLSVKNLQFVTNNQGIDQVFFNTFHGGSGSDWWPEREVNAYFDNFIVSPNAADVGL